MKTACDRPLAFYVGSHHPSVSSVSVLALSVLCLSSQGVGLSPLSRILVFTMTNMMNTYLVLSTWKSTILSTLHT